MMALHVGLRRAAPPAGIVGYSGLLAGPEHLAQITVRPPILLIHGEADDNSGTFPVQSERFYAALKGAGANVRYVVLPYEAHGYRARESVGHTLWEMTGWLDALPQTANSGDIYASLEPGRLLP